MKEEVTMRYLRLMFSVGMFVCLLSNFSCPLVNADTSTPQLIISQLKITSSSGQFVTLYNASNQSLDLSKFQLEYFNNFDLPKATSSRLISLSGMLSPYQYYQISDATVVLCYQLTVNATSLGFSSTAGMVEVLGLNQSTAGMSAVPTLQDYVAWSKTVATGAQTLPANQNAFLQRQPIDANNNPTIGVPGLGNWQTVQPDSGNACSLVTASGATVVPVATGLNQLLPASAPIATVVDPTSIDPEDTTPQASLPASDTGLKAPMITELLPNPDGTGNDATDEFIELYNPNSVTFDLSGFSLQVGSTIHHSFTFPSGTSLDPKSFVAYYSADTGLSLSNTAGQASLLDPFGNSIANTSSYVNAKDGQAWDLASGGNWAWSTTPTPEQQTLLPCRPQVGVEPVKNNYR